MKKSQIDQEINRITRNGRLRRPVRAKSLIATVFGDFIEPYGGRIWLGDLITLVKLFDINERLLRTSVFRLAEEGFVEKTREGRRSVYELTMDGREQTALAGQLLYQFKQKSWNGVWNFVISTSKDIPVDKNLQLHRRLSLMGFGVLSKNIFVHPDTDNELVKKVVIELGLQKQVLVMQSQSIASDSTVKDYINDRELVKQCCPYDESETMYNHFIRAYTPLIEKLRKSRSVPENICFKIRILLMHDYRRLLFKDPQLPAELLPSDWSGDRAREVVKEVYLLTYKPANSFYLDVCADDVLKPGLNKTFFSRFDGLQK